MKTSTKVAPHVKGKVRGKGPTAQLRYLLPGRHPIQSTTSSLLPKTTTTMTKHGEPDMQQFWSMEAIGTNAP